MIREKQRFDDVGGQRPDGGVDYCYRGFNYQLTIDGHDFQVRTYDDEPGEATVISPTTAQQHPGATQLVRYLTAELGCSRLKFYHGPTGAYRAVNPTTLEFQ